MSPATASLTKLNNALQDHAGNFAVLSLEKAERFARFNLESARVVFGQGVYTAQAIAGITDAAGISALNAKLAETAILNVRAYSRGVYQVAAAAQADFSKAAEAAWAASREGVMEWVNAAGKDVPAGSLVALDALKSTVAATSAAFEHFSLAQQRAARLADNVIRTATTAHAAPATANGRKTR